ncbi:hypothetical protein BV898_05090 [Hypsibius exemplaris]|uniref:Uncharacterized protein n=1 Tax=Hypsibius exemplaris TaxID=2072580 RepID=A0A1W0X0J9_HYPEX|nr:hypothetical protein BV898_05090 [Hypsibius exemplaris]
MSAPRGAYNGRSPRSVRGSRCGDRRPKEPQERCHVDACFDIICDMAKERGVTLFRVVAKSATSSTLACNLCPECFCAQKEERLFRRHVVHHFDEDGASDDWKCLFTWGPYGGCPFRAAGELELRRHQAFHGDSPRPEAASVLTSILPAQQLLLQFPRSDSHLVVNLCAARGTQI